MGRSERVLPEAEPSAADRPQIRMHKLWGQTRNDDRRLLHYGDTMAALDTPTAPVETRTRHQWPWEAGTPISDEEREAAIGMFSRFAYNLPNVVLTRPSQIASYTWHHLRSPHPTMDELPGSYTDVAYLQHMVSQQGLTLSVPDGVDPQGVRKAINEYVQHLLEKCDLRKVSEAYIRRSR